MISEAEANAHPVANIERLIPIDQAAAALGVCARTLARLLDEHGIAIVRLSPRKRGLLPTDYADLLRRCRREATG